MDAAIAELKRKWESTQQAEDREAYIRERIRCGEAEIDVVQELDLTDRFLELQEQLPDRPWKQLTPKQRSTSLVSDIKPGAEMPWLTWGGAGFVKVYDMRWNEEENRVDFGVGNETLPILGWVQAKDFMDEWPK